MKYGLKRYIFFCPNYISILSNNLFLQEEDSRAQALYLIPQGKQVEFIKISGHRFVEDATNRLYTVYRMEMTCGNCQWMVYRRYQEFKTLHDQVVLYLFLM